MNKDIINVGLYGGKNIFGGKESPLEASIIYCDKHESCSYYKNNQCHLVRSFGSTGCKFGTTSTVRGYTSRARKYHEFRNKWKDNEQYGKLSHPPTKLGLIDGLVVFPYPYVSITKHESGKWIIDDPAFFNSNAYIPYEEFTIDFIKRICSFRPQAMMGGTISSYQKETVPLFLAHLKEVLPDKYIEFANEFPEYSEKNIDYVGRKALLKTIKPSSVYKESRDYPNLDSEWYWDGEFLIYKNGYVGSFSVIDSYKIEEIKLKPTEKTVVKITSNEQVSKETVFVD